MNVSVCMCTYTETNSLLININTSECNSDIQAFYLALSTLYIFIHPDFCFTNVVIFFRCFISCYVQLIEYFKDIWNNSSVIIPPTGYIVRFIAFFLSFFFFFAFRKILFFSFSV